MKVNKKSLLLLAAVVWGIAGFNVLRIGIITYPPYLSLLNLLLSALVFFLFHKMVFGKLVKKHCRRICGYGEEKQFFLKFFDTKSFCIMAFMITFGVLLRSFHLVPQVFIAVFYSGLGASLFLAGILFAFNYQKAACTK